MSTPRDRAHPERNAPALHLVHDAGADGEGSAASDGVPGTDAEEVPADGDGSAAAADDEPPPSRAVRPTAGRPAPRTLLGPTSGRPVEQAEALLAEVDPTSYYRMLTGLVRSSHSSVLQELAYNPALSFHDPRCVIVEPEPTNVETIELYARAAYPDFDRVLAAAFADPANDHLLTELYHLLIEEGENVALVTNHGQIIDIALVIGALFVAMLDPEREFGVLGERIEFDDLADRSNMLVSRMVTTRQAFNVPAVQVLQSAARTFLSVPQTANRRRSRLDPELARANNVVMRDALHRRLDDGGQMLVMAASGTQDLTIPALVKKARAAWRQRRGDDPGERSTLHLQPLYDGTITLMRSCRYVLPIAINLDPGSPACVIGSMTRVRDAQDCHRIMDWIALAHQDATEVPTIYHWHEDDLLTHVRGLLNRSSS